MKALNLALMVLALFMVATVGGCRKHGHTTFVPVPVDTTIYTPQHLAVVDIQDPDGLLATGTVTQATLLSDLDYQVLYVWYTRELNEAGHPNFDSLGLQTLAHSVRWHLIVSKKFEDSERHVRFAQIGNDIYLATEHLDKIGRRCADADSAMDLYTDDTHEGDDNPSPTPLAPGTDPVYPH
jgi:hypothetical protein